MQIGRSLWSYSFFVSHLILFILLKILYLTAQHWSGKVEGEVQVQGLIPGSLFSGYTNVVHLRKFLFRQPINISQTVYKNSSSYVTFCFIFSLTESSQRWEVVKEVTLEKYLRNVNGMSVKS